MNFLPICVFALQSNRSTGQTDRRTDILQYIMRSSIGRVAQFQHEIGPAHYCANMQATESRMTSTQMSKIAEAVSSHA